MVPQLQRREFVILSSIACATASQLISPAVKAALAAESSIGIAFSLYGMRSLSIVDAIRACREIGYDGVELPVMVDWPGDSGRLSADDRRRIRDQLVESKIRLSGLMENLVLLAPEATHQANLQRLQAAAQLARDLAPAAPPVIETVLGGRPDQWERTREEMADRLRDWAKALESSQGVLAVKPHVGGALHTPDGAKWLVEQVASPRIRVAFDFSHYQLRGLDLADCLKTLLPMTAFIHVKDALGTPEKFQFLLPGEGTTSYESLFRQLHAVGHRGDVVVEVSGQIHSRAGYDPLDAARRSYQALAAAAQAAGVRNR
jgi:sugar phosphate isomerase/epimerase